MTCSSDWCWTKQAFSLVVACVCVLPMAESAPVDDAAIRAIRGRPLPEPEFLQPRLDDRLPDYRPCGRKDRSAKLEGSAPAILPALVDKWVHAFHAHYPKTRIDVPPPYLEPQGSSPPMRKFLEGRSDFAFVSRDMSLADLATFRRAHGYEALSIPVVAGAYRHFGFVDAVTVIVNSQNPIEHLDFAQLDSIFSKSRLRGYPPVSTWGDLGVQAWTDKPIHVVGAVAWNTVESARAITIRDRVLSDALRGQWRDDLPSVGTEADVPTEVAADPYAIGFTGMGHLVDGTKTIALSDSSDNPHYYPPSYEDIAGGRYPLARVVYLAVAKPPGKSLDPALHEFIRFVLSKQGQQIVLDQGVFLPLRNERVQRALRLLDPGDESGNGICTTSTLCASPLACAFRSTEHASTGRSSRLSNGKSVRRRATSK